MKAVIDRFEEDYAVILLGEEETQIDVPIKLLPDSVKNSKEGTWLKVIFNIDYEESEKQNKVLMKVNFETNMDETKEREKRISNLLNKLKNKSV